MLEPRDLRRISAECLLDLRTIAKAYGGKPVTLASRALICLAAEALGLPPPPPPAAQARPGAGGE